MATRLERSPLPDLGLLIGRIMLAVLYVMSGWGKLTGFGGTIGMLSSRAVPYPTAAAALAVVFELGGAVLIVLGWWTRLAALALFVFTAIATDIAHQYWTYPPDQAMVQYINFWKNVGLAGGWLVLAAVGAGRLSLDGTRSRR